MERDTLTAIERARDSMAEVYRLDNIFSATIALIAAVALVFIYLAFSSIGVG